MKKLITILFFICCSFNILNAQFPNLINIYLNTSLDSTTDRYQESLYLYPRVDVGQRALLQNIDGPKVHIDYDATIVVDVQVDSEGKVVQATINKQKTTVKEGDLTNQCLVNAKALNFNKSDSSISLEHGTIEYDYSYEKVEFLKGHIDDLPCNLTIKGFNKRSLNDLAMVMLPNTTNFDTIHKLYSDVKFRISQNNKFVPIPIQNEGLNKYAKFYDQEFENSFTEYEWKRIVPYRMPPKRMIEYQYCISNKKLGLLRFLLSDDLVDGCIDYNLNIYFEADPKITASEYKMIYNDLKRLFNINDDFDHHMKFLDIPINGHINDFSNKLNSKGFTPSSWVKSDSKLFTGFFFNQKCNVVVFFSPRDKIVNTVKVIFPQMNNIFQLKELYRDVKTGMLKKYSLPSFISNDEDAFLNNDTYAGLVEEIRQMPSSVMNLYNFNYGIYSGDIQIDLMEINNNLCLVLFYTDKENVVRAEKNHYSDL